MQLSTQRSVCVYVIIVENRALGTPQAHPLLFSRACVPPVSFQLRRLFCVLSRYETLSATSDGYQMAFPASGFRLLRHLVSVECECFASPLNCTLRRLVKFFVRDGVVVVALFARGWATPIGTCERLTTCVGCERATSQFHSRFP